MSRAELKAHEIFFSMQLANIDDEVRRHLMILLLTVPQQNDQDNVVIPRNYEEALRMGAKDAEFVREDLHKYVEELA